MHRTIIRTADVYDFDQLPNPLKVGNQPATSPIFERHVHPQVGTLAFRNRSFPHMHIVDMKWTSVEELTLLNEIPTDTVNFLFQFSGENHIHFSELKGPWESYEGEHTMYHHPDGDFYNQVKAGKTMEVLHISFDKAFFSASIGEEDAWSEDLQRNLDLRRAFTGAKKPLELTPAMKQLLTNIRSFENPDPMRNLVVQSNVLELIALQIDQMRNPAKATAGIRSDEYEKLYGLKTYLDANFLSDLSLAQLCRQCVLNEFKVKRGFKTLFGTTVFNYIKKKRMDYALNLLQRKSYTVDEVAEALGYEHAHHFSAAFKAHFGATPSSYKARF